MARDFVVTRPQEADAPRIAEIHLAAMDANPLLHAQFPARDSLTALRRFMEDYALEQLRNPTTGFLVARDPETDVVAGFVKWDSPSHPADGKLESGDLRYLEGCRREFLDGYASLAEEAKKRCFGEQACYCMCYQLSPVFYRHSRTKYYTRPWPCSGSGVSISARPAAGAAPIFTPSGPALRLSTNTEG